MTNSDNRTRYWEVLLALMLLAVAGPMLAGEEAEELPRFLDEIVVTGRAEAAEGDLVPREAMESGRYINIGEAIADMPGIGAVRRGASATEPVIRGLGWERVATVMMGGMITATVLTLVVLPALYALVEKAALVLRDRAGHKDT